MSDYYDDEYVEFADEDESDEQGFAEEEDGEFGEGFIEYECPHCGATVQIDADDVDFDEECLCPECGKELFPELPDDAEEEPDNEGEE